MHWQNPPGYNDLKCFARYAEAFIKNVPGVGDMDHYLFMDAHGSHMNEDALQNLLDHRVIPMFLRSNNSDIDQPNDNGVNAHIKACYKKEYDAFFSMGMNGFGRSVEIKPPHFNEIFKKAWHQVTLNPALVVRAFERTGIFPLNRNASNYGALGVNLSSAFTGALTTACVNDPRDVEGTAALVNAAPLDISTGPLAVMLKKRSSAEDPDGTGANVVIRQFVYENILKPHSMNASQLNTVLQNFKRAKGSSMTASTLPTKSGLVMNHQLCQQLRDNKARKDAQNAEKLALLKARHDARQQQLAASFQAAQALLASIRGKDAQGVQEMIKTEKVKVGTMKDLLSHLAATTEEKSSIPKMKKAELIEKICSVVANGGQNLQEIVLQPTAMEVGDEEGEGEENARGGGANTASNPAMDQDRDDHDFDSASDVSEGEFETDEA